jgi:hypothetical protein
MVARIFVGFSVMLPSGKIVHKYSMDDLAPIVRRIRKKQGRDQDSTYVYQRGVYTHAVDKKVVTEEGVQVFIIDMEGLEQKEFTEEIVDLCDIITTKLEQETVVVELQMGGVVKDTFVVMRPDLYKRIPKK